MDFIIDELKIRETKELKAIKSLRIALSNQKEDLLAFAQVLDEKLAKIAHKFENSSLLGTRGVFTEEKADEHQFILAEVESVVPTTF